MVKILVVSKGREGPSLEKENKLQCPGEISVYYPEHVKT